MVEKKTISEWTSIIDFMKKQIDSKGVNNLNIAGMQCETTITRNKINRTKISNIKVDYQRSEFGGLDQFIKKHSNPGIDKSLLCIFKSEDPQIVFFESALKFHILRKGADILERHLSNIQSQCLEGKTICAISYGNTASLYHAFAIIFWQNETSFNCAIYDPMYYIRSNSDYKWAVETAQKELKLIFPDIQIKNLSEMCYKPEKGVRCVQYIMNAEYCTIFSLYFIYLYVLHKCPKDDDGFQHVIDQTYIVDKAQLNRAPCKATNIFRLIFITFTIHVILAISSWYTHEDINILYDKIRTMYKNIKNEGYEILGPQLLTKIHYNESESTDPQIQQFLQNHPDHILVNSIVTGNKYTLLYKTGAKYTGLIKEINNSYVRYKNYNTKTPSIVINTDSGFIDKSNIIAVFQQKRRGGKKNTVRRNTHRKKSLSRRLRLQPA